MHVFGRVGNTQDIIRHRRERPRVLRGFWKAFWGLTDEIFLRRWQNYEG